MRGFFSSACLLPSQFAFSQQRPKIESEHENENDFWGERSSREYSHFTYIIYLCFFISMEPLFDHEKLDVYCVELQFTTWIADFLCDVLRSLPPHRRELIDQLDRASLSMLLNTAEGNGKRHGGHRAKFSMTPVARHSSAPPASMRR